MPTHPSHPFGASNLDKDSYGSSPNESIVLPNPAFSDSLGVENEPRFGHIFACSANVQEARVAWAAHQKVGTLMDRTLAEHIRNLEQKLNSIGTQIMEENDPHKRNHLESELRAVESALTHYRSAYEIESRLSAIAVP